MPTSWWRALPEAQIARVWQNPEDFARVSEQPQATVWITSACVRVAEGCFELASGPCTIARRCNEGRGIFASRPNTCRSIRANT